jgi:hypothetical protein
MKRSRITAGALLCAGSIACGTKEHHASPPAGAPHGAGGDDLIDISASSGPPAADAGGLCGNEVHKLIIDAPNIYFVFDASGSMASITESGSTRYQLVRKAASDLIRKLGPLINVGAALFPRGATDADPCHPGDQVLPMSPGDPVSKTLGPTGLAFSNATAITPFGGTPTGATLSALFPTLTALGKRTIVVLATDGGPNCNPNASCSIDECMPNIEGQCSATVNCCAPKGPAGPTMCLDRKATVDAVATLANAGIPVYVVGIPGSEVYGSVLDDMALAGGAPDIAPPFYYKVNDFSSLGAVLGSIAAIEVSCTFDLEDPPAETGFTNVYFDATAVPYDDKDGWAWQAPSSIELFGKACQKLKSGAVAQVQIVSGCPTEAPR